MPTLPWTPVDTPETDGDVVVLGSVLHLRSFRHVPGFLRAAMQIRKQVRRSPGAVGVALIAQPTRRRFWTLSAWAGQGALDAFVQEPPHVDVMARYGKRLDDARFATWSRPAAGLPKRNSNAKELFGESRTRLAEQTPPAR